METVATFPPQQHHDKTPSCCFAKHQENLWDPNLDDILAQGQKLIEETNLALLLSDMDTLFDEPILESQAETEADSSEADLYTAGMLPSTPPLHGKRCVTPRSISPVSRSFNEVLEVDLELSKSSPAAQETLSILKKLGSTLLSKADPFIDLADVEDPGTPRKSRGGFYSLFPDKLHYMLNGVAQEGKEDIVSFLPHGRAFVVHDMERFLGDVLPRYFNGQRKWGSFARQLNLYGYLRVKDGRDEGAYYHPLFLAGRQSLARYMRRVGTSHGGPDRRKLKQPQGTDPDFYSLRPLRVSPPSFPSL